MAARQLSSAGIALLEYLEGLKLSADQDDAGVWTIGYGHTGVEVVSGLTITTDQALVDLQQDLHSTYQSLLGIIPETTTTHQYDACILMAYNVGAYGWASSTLCRVLQTRGAQGVTRDMFTRWNKIKDPKTGMLVVEPGLTRRRNLEFLLFSAPDSVIIDTTVIAGWDTPNLLTLC